MIVETWRPIPDFPGYDISDHGRVRSYYACNDRAEWYISDAPQRILRPGQSGGYPFVGLCTEHKRYSRRIHSLVLLAFVGPRPDGLECCHNDGDPANNRLSNLRYDTHLANSADTHRHRGEWPGSKLNDSDVIRMRHMGASGVRDTELAKLFQVGIETVHSVCAGRSHRAISGPLVSWRDGKLSNKLSDGAIRNMRRERRDTGRSLGELETKYGMSQSAIHSIIKGKSRVAAGGPIEERDYPPPRPMAAEWGRQGAAARTRNLRAVGGA